MSCISTSIQSIQLHQIGRPLIRLIEIQMIFKFCAYIKCVDRKLDRCHKTELKRTAAQTVRFDACVRPPPKWIYILKIVIKWMRFGWRVQKMERDFHCKLHQLCDVNRTESSRFERKKSWLFSIPSSSSSTSSTWHGSTVSKSGGLFVFMLKNTSAYNGQRINPEYQHQKAVATMQTSP